jgi:hypothetical protein
LNYRTCVFLLFLSISVKSSYLDYIYQDLSVSHNVFGQGGIIHLPSAETKREANLSFTYNDNGMWKLGTLTVNPFNWMEASYFYYRPKDLQGSGGEPGKYLDKGFNIKFAYKPKNNNLPMVALGLDDFAGTGLFTKEYMVATLPYKNIKITTGLGWGSLVGDNKISNPLSFFISGFDNRASGFASQGGTLNYGKWFRGKATPLYALEYTLPRKNGLKLKIENDPFNYFKFSSTGAYGPESSRLRKKNSDINFGLSLPLAKRGNLDISYIKGNMISVNFTFSLSFEKNVYEKKKFNPQIEKKFSNFDKKNNFYRDLLSNLAKNKIYLQTASITKEEGLSITVDSADIANPIQSASRAAYIAKKSSQLNDYDFKYIDVSNLYLGMELNNVKFLNKDLDLNKRNLALVKNNSLISNPDPYDYNNHEFQPKVNFPVINNSILPDIRSHVGTPSKFYFGGLGAKIITEVQLRRNLVILSNLGFSLVDNFDEKVSYPGSRLPHVRTEVVDYLQKDSYLTQLEINYYKELYPNLYAKLSAGMFETMFGGVGAEILYKPFNTNIYIGFESYNVKRRTYNQRFKFFNYLVRTEHVNLAYHHERSGIIIKSSYGKYLAKDKGYTLDVSRKTKSGFQAGFYFTRTDVPPLLFGEGSFDKGFYFKIPNRIFSKSHDKKSTPFSLSPLTRDGGQKLDLSNRLTDMIHNDQLFSIGLGWNEFLN